MREMEMYIAPYVEEMRRLAIELGTSPEVISSALMLRKLESISSQLYNQGYHRGFENALDEQMSSDPVEHQPPDRRWQSPATSQRLVD